MSAYAFGTCPHCQSPPGDGAFCGVCGILSRYPDAGAFAASRSRRFVGYLLETVLILGTLGIGWLIWLAMVAGQGQTPAKKLLGMYILRADGTPVTAKRVWLRDVLIELVFLGIISSFLFGIVGILDGIWIFWDKNRQTLHDKMADTIVVHPRLGALRFGDLGAGPSGTQQRSGFDRPGGAQPGTGAYGSAASHEERLRELRQLADRGLITSAEYEERRRRIIDDL